jgi:hypothetical protein
MYVYIYIYIYTHTHIHDTHHDDAEQVDAQARAAVAQKSESESTHDGRPTTEFHKPKGIEWEDRSGQTHFTKASKPKQTVHTGDAKELPPPDSGGFSG